MPVSHEGPTGSYFMAVGKISWKEMNTIIPGAPWQGEGGRDREEKRVTEKSKQNKTGEREREKRVTEKSKQNKKGERESMEGQLH